MIKAKKSLGQNFLKNKKVLEKIVSAGKISDETVLEIGPGKGALTSEILKKAKKLILIEKDKRLIPILEEKYHEEIKNKKIEIYEGDALDLDYKKIGLEKKEFSIISNLPYYITGKFLSNVLENKIQPKKIVLLLQKEIVERITGEEWNRGQKKIKNKENILSVSVKVYGDVKYIGNVSKKNFSPEPKVDSAILGIYNISKNFFTKNKIDEKKFFEFIKIAFSSKRKKIIKNLSQKWDKKDLEKTFEKLKLNLDTRAEDLSIDDFKNIFLEIEK